MKRIQVCKARGARGGANEPDSLHIVADTAISEDLNPQQSRNAFARDAGLIAEALWATLPGGTLDALVVALMEHKASQFHVAMGAFDKPAAGGSA